jgi:lysophospholipase L1-like esterase
MLTWSTNGLPVTEWQPYIGSEPGEFDLFTTGSLGTSSGILATGLPTDGTAIYLRLYYKEGGTWDFIDAQYTAAIRPKLTTPEPNWLLNGADVTFEWVSNGAPVTDYQLNVGTSPGGMDLFESGFLGSSLSTTAFGLPINSNIVWVRLLFKSNGNWDSDDYQYITGSIGDYYGALGDSITRGIGDFDMSDYTSQDGQITGGGYPPILHDFLLAEKGYPNKIVNEGVEGETSLGGLMRVPGVLAKYPNAKFYLIQYGTNDAGFVPSGLGLNPGDAGYPGSFKDTMQQIIDLVKSQGKTPMLALVPYTTKAFKISDIIDYNRVITGYNNGSINDPGLIATNGLAVVPPNFYAHFEANPQQLNSDGVHPTGAGFRTMGDLWCGALIGLPFPSTCSTP